MAYRQKPALASLLVGLEAMAYRGYDSAGLAVFHSEQAETEPWQSVRVVGKIHALVAESNKYTISGQVGIGHTRWATHGAPSIHNAHPHSSGVKVTLVHNGVIEKLPELMENLQFRGFSGQSETDSEWLAHWLVHQCEQGSTPLDALRSLLTEVHGSMAIACLFASDREAFYVLRRASPMWIGSCADGWMAASDQLALANNHCLKRIVLNDGEIARISSVGCSFFDSQGQPIAKNDWLPVAISAHQVDKGAYHYFMEKEIDEQPQALRASLSDWLSHDQIVAPDAHVDRFAELPIQKIHILACGSSYHAGLLASYWFERLARIPTQVEIASEFRYRQPCFAERTLFLSLSQSGETADTLAACAASQHAKNSYHLAICNVAYSSLAKMADLHILTQAGPEIGVATTKAFTAQLAVMLCFALLLAQKRCLLPDPSWWIKHLRALPNQIESQLEKAAGLSGWVDSLSHKHHIIYSGRDLLFPIALEGALKLKEISYIHAEGVAGGELKHGPLAMIDQDRPLVALMASNLLYEKVRNNLSEVQARNGPLFVLADDACPALPWPEVNLVQVPSVISDLVPFTHVVALQQLAFLIAKRLGADIDQPRHLAKSVTVE